MKNTIWLVLLATAVTYSQQLTYDEKLFLVKNKLASPRCLNDENNCNVIFKWPSNPFLLKSKLVVLSYCRITEFTSESSARASLITESEEMDNQMAESFKASLGAAFTTDTGLDVSEKHQAKMSNAVNLVWNPKSNISWEIDQSFRIVALCLNVEKNFSGDYEATFQPLFITPLADKPVSNVSDEEALE